MTNQLPSTTKVRQKAYDVIDGERDYQNATHPSSPPKTLTDHTNLLIEYTDKLAADVVAGKSSSPTGGPLKRLREIAAIAVHAMEEHGIQPRENHVPASAGITGTLHATAKPDSMAPAAKTPLSASATTDAAKIAALPVAVAAATVTVAPVAHTAMAPPPTTHTTAAPHPIAPPPQPAHLPHQMVREETGVTHSTTQHPNEKK